MSLTLNDFSTTLLGTAAFQRPSVLKGLPPWLEAGVIGLFLGAYLGLLCAFLYRRRKNRSIARARVRSTSSREPVFESAVPHVCVAHTIHQIDKHLDDLAGVSGPHQSEAWGEVLHQYRADFERLRGQIE